MSDSVPERGKVVRMPTIVSVFGPFRFEQRTGRLSRGDAEIHLTPRASNVLRFLLARRGEIVTKDELFADVWKDVSVTDDALLQVVSVLRKALGDDPRRPEYIQTVTGEGYRFIGEVHDGAVAAQPMASVPGGPLGALRSHAATGPRGAARSEAAPPLPQLGVGPMPVAGPPATGARWGTAVIGVVLAAVALVAWGVWSGGFDSEAVGVSAGDVPSIAVLPFLNLSDDPANEYFSDGLAEELISRLGTINGLRVAARTSSFSFKGRPADVGEIGRQLNVATILEGSAQRDGDRVRIIARLVNVDDGFELWSATYDRESDDVFAIQQDIATRVAEALTIPLLGDEAALLARAPTDSPEAFEAYMRGNYFLARYTGSAFEAAARDFDRAINLDPDFALAYVGLADAYLMQNRYGVLPLPDALAIAEPALDRAMQIDNRLGNAHAILGLARQRKGDIPGAQAAYERAIDLDPDSARAYQLYWWMLFVREGNTEKTLELSAKALAADPYSPAQNENSGWPLFQAGRFDEALVYFEMSIEMEPAYPFGYSAIGAYHRAMGQMDEAIASFEKAIDLSPETARFRVHLAHALASIGRTDEAMTELDHVISNEPGQGGRYADVGEVYWDVLGRPSLAVSWYQDAIERNPGSARLRTMLALVCLDLDDREAAGRWVESTEAIDPDNRWAQIGRSNLYMYDGDYAEGANLVRRAAGTVSFLGYLHQYDRPYTEFAPLGYFSLLAGRPSDALSFPTRAYPGLMEDDPVINGFNLNAAIDLAATLRQTREDDRADTLLHRSLEFIESQREDLRDTRYREEPAEIYALRGMVPEALVALRRAIDLGWRRGWWRARHKPHYESLRSEPEFEAMMAELEAEAETMRLGPQSCSATLQGVQESGAFAERFTR